jgi:hypothetical protein
LTAGLGSACAVVCPILVLSGGFHVVGGNIKGYVLPAGGSICGGGSLILPRITSVVSLATLVLPLVVGVTHLGGQVFPVGGVIGRGQGCVLS